MRHLPLRQPSKEQMRSSLITSHTIPKCSFKIAFKGPFCMRWISLGQNWKRRRRSCSLWFPYISPIPFWKGKRIGKDRDSLVGYMLTIKKKRIGKDRALRQRCSDKQRNCQGKDFSAPGRPCWSHPFARHGRRKTSARPPSVSYETAPKQKGRDPEEP